MFIQVPTIVMKVFNFFTSNSYYNFNLAALKFIGFAFFSVKYSRNKIKFHRSFLNCAAFFLSTAFSVVVLVVEGQQRTFFQVKSPILSVAMVVLFRLSMVGIVATKIIYFFGHKEVFNYIQCLINIDKKVISLQSPTDKKSAKTPEYYPQLLISERL